MKRIIDLVGCVGLLIVVAPVLLAVVLAIRLDTPGPIMFSQSRVGKDGRRFRMYKFRTMVVNAEELKSELLHLSIVPPPDFKILDDPRVTRVGRFLRSTSLDELPQLLNVLRGEMSLVGPRPISIPPERWQLWHTRRLEVLPGLTGLWQVEGRNTTAFDDRLRLDLSYIDNQSLWLDVQILFRTASAVLQRTGA